MGWQSALNEWIEEPHKLGHLLGFTKLSKVHDDWISLFLRVPQGGETVLQAHRNAYKTTAGLVAMTLLYMLYPNIRVLIVRKTIKNAEKLVQAMEKIFETPLVRAWFYSRHGLKSLKTDVWSNAMMTLACKNTITAEPSMQAAGIGTSMTGTHFDYIWPDDIVTDEDRYSMAEREKTKNYVYELGNIIEPLGSRMYTGTAWHPQDAFSVLPAPHRYPIGSVKIIGIDDAWIADKKKRIPNSLWAANYELRHVKDIDPEFGEFQWFKDLPPDTWWRMYIDPAFMGKDYVAIVVGAHIDGKFLIRYGQLFQKNIAKMYQQIRVIFEENECADLYYEANAAQILVGEGLQGVGLTGKEVNSVKNKHVRIMLTLKPVWDMIHFHESMLTQQEPEQLTEGAHVTFISQVAEYTEGAEHEDAPDALAGLVESFNTGATAEQLLAVHELID